MITTDNFKLEYVYSGLFTTNNNWIHPKKNEITYELIYVISGDVFLDEAGKKYHLRKNDLIILEPNTEHFGYHESTSPVSFYWTHFHIDDFAKLQIPVRYIQNYTDSFIFKKMLHTANNPLYPGSAAEVLLLTILNDIAFFTQRTPENENRIVYDAAEWIRINSNKKIYTEDVSARYEMNHQYFSKLFKKHYNIGLKEYICRERLSVAKNLLCNTNLSVKEIAAEMNFTNENEFINYFKYHQKQSPKKFRNSFSRVHMNNK